MTSPAQLATLTANTEITEIERDLRKAHIRLARAAALVHQLTITRDTLGAARVGLGEGYDRALSAALLEMEFAAHYFADTSHALNEAVMSDDHT